MKAFLIDVAKCNGCHNCQISCKDEHCGTEWMPYAADQPMTGHFWCKVEEKVRGSVPVVRVSYTPLVCGHCDDAPCLAAAKDGAVYRRDDGLVVIDPAKAKGQRAIMDACPMGAVYWNEELDLPQ
ncbi:4Fe-4S dicluster domain-containing protein [Gordonibacter urolithinfaciens]